MRTQQMQRFPTQSVRAWYLAPICFETCIRTGKANGGKSFAVPHSPGRAKRLYPYPSSNRRHRRR
jgi:hypothetical protein